MNLFDFLKGTAKYRIEIERAENFINSVKRDASVKNLVINKDGTLGMSCFYKERDVVEKNVQANGGIILKRKMTGLPVFANILKQRAGLLAGVLISACLVMLSSLFVWEIRVEGNEKLSDKEVIEMLNEAGFREGMLKTRVNIKKVTDRLLINEDAVSWMAINFDGTVAHVEMKEAKIAQPVSKKENVNLVASANGIILRVDALEGGTKVQRGDAVTKGQLLVSAFVDKRTGGSLLRGARGFVWANTQRKFLVVVPFEYKTKKYTENECKEYSFTFLGKTLHLSNPIKTVKERCEFVKNQEKLTLLRKATLPITVGTVRRSEYIEYTSRRTKEQALEVARQTAKERLFEISPDFAIADVDEKCTVEDGKFIYECSFEGIENIAKELEFELS